MSRFNTLATDNSKTFNHEGGESYSVSPEMELYKTICTSILNNKFYESDTDTLDRIKTLISQCDPLYVAQLAVYAREEMNLRSIPLVMTVELAKIHNGDSLISKLTERVIQRADEITEILGYYQISNGRTGTKKLNKLSKQLAKGIANSFDKFEEYHFGKYNRNTEIKFRDALFLSHAKSKSPEQRDLFNKIINDELAIPYTWETQLSEAGKMSGRSKKEVWEELIDSRKVGYMAILRNLVNILEADVSADHIQKVCDYISNETAVKRSRQLPFRFLSSYRMLVGMPNRRSFYWGRDGERNGVDSIYVPEIAEALEKAIVLSVNNINIDKNDKILIATDVSASMITPISERSVIFQYDIGAVLSMLLNNKMKYTTTGLFGNTFETFNFPKGSVLRNTNEIYELEGRVGYSTNGHKVLEYANKSKQKYDRIMIFTDCQLYGGSIVNEWNKYKIDNPDCKLYVFDLDGYRHSPFSEKGNDSYLISGWSDKVFDMMNSIENGNKVIDVIKSIKL